MHEFAFALLCPKFRPGFKIKKGYPEDDEYAYPCREYLTKYYGNTIMNC